MKITGLPKDSLTFKVPSLRNVSVSFPYMHPLLANKLTITNAQKYELIYFLNTLTDTSMTKNPRFAR